MFDNIFAFQTTVLSIIIITLVIIALLLVVNKKLRDFDPLSEPKGIVLLVIMGAQMVDNLVKDKTNESISKYLTPYIMSVVVYVFLSNIAGLFSLECPTSNYSVTLSLALITCILIELYSGKERGISGYIKSWFEPLAPMVLVNALGKVSTLLSLSLRLFGNIIAGSALMQVIYNMLQTISNYIPVIGKINPVSLIVAPFLHFYFDLFSGAMQAFIFIVLSVSFIGKELPTKEEE